MWKLIFGCFCDWKSFDRSVQTGIWANAPDSKQDLQNYEPIPPNIKLPIDLLACKISNWFSSTGKQFSSSFISLANRDSLIDDAILKLKSVLKPQKHSDNNERYARINEWPFRNNPIILIWLYSFVPISNKLKTYHYHYQSILSDLDNRNQRSQ